MALDHPDHRRRRWTALLLAISLAALVVVVAVVTLRRSASEGDSPAPAGAAGPRPDVREPEPARLGSGDGFLASDTELAAVADLAAAGDEPWSSALDDLRAEADDALERRPRPETPLDIKRTTGVFVDDSADAYTLALAYALTGKATYAEGSARVLRAWSTTARETRNTCTDEGWCDTSLVIGRVAPAFIFAADLIEPAGVLSDEDEATFRSWIGDVLLPAASERTNNWGDAGTFFRIAATSYLDDEEAFAAAVETWREQLGLIRPDGEIPEETRRGRKGLQYSQEALLYKVASARIAAARGVDLWAERGTGGGTLEAALDLVARSMSDPESWRWHDDVEVPSPAPLWELAAARWDKPAYRALAEAGRPFGPDGHSAIRWTTLAGGASSA